MTAATRPFVAEPVGDVAAARRRAGEAAHRWGLPEPVLVRVGMNALFSCGDVMLRVGRTTVDPSQAAGLHELLAAHGVPVAKYIDSIAADLDGLSVIAQERLASAGVVDWREVGAIVRRVHDIDPATVARHVPVPECTSFGHWRFTEMLGDIVDDATIALTDDERRALERAVARLEPWRERIAASGSTTVLCHGDVHPGNVMATTSGTVLLDWDLLCSGPAAWDHTAVLTWESRWGGQAGLYEQFAEGSGEDLRGDPLAQMLAEGRLLAATSMRLLAGRTDADALAEGRRRLRYWLGDPDAPVWVAA